MSIITSRSASAVHADATITFDAPKPVGWSNTIASFSWSYSGGTPVGSITILDGITPIWSVDVTQAGPGVFNFPMTINASPDAILSIKLSDGGPGITGKINCVSRMVQLKP